MVLDSCGEDYGSSHTGCYGGDCGDWDCGGM